MHGACVKIKKIEYLALYMRIDKSCKASVRVRYKCEELAQNMEKLRVFVKTVTKHSVPQNEKIYLNI
jgi:hypothetical protein